MTTHPYLAFVLVLIGTFVLAACGPYADEAPTPATLAPMRATNGQGARQPILINDPPVYIGDKFEEVQRELARRGAAQELDAPTF